MHATYRHSYDATNVTRRDDHNDLVSDVRELTARIAVLEAALKITPPPAAPDPDRPPVIPAA